MPKNEAAIVKQKTDAIEAMVESVKVTNDAERDAVSDKIRQVKDCQEAIEDMRNDFVAPAKAIIAKARETYDWAIKRCVNAEAALKAKALKYMEAQRDKTEKDQNTIAKKVEDGKMKPETAIKKLETLTEAPKTVRTDKGSGLRMSMRKKVEISDENLIPDEYWEINRSRLNKDALDRDKNNLPQIPGIVIREEAELASI